MRQCLCNAVNPILKVNACPVPDGIIVAHTLDVCQATDGPQGAIWPDAIVQIVPKRNVCTEALTVEGSLGCFKHPHTTLLAIILYTVATTHNT